ncbi:uncharacterized protein LOC126818884 [Patella vulgata]|uniref:uncharacterized protein LOC126818884 n=1 Tax=Patella vulgata TaxID=6465 RepID=UPI00217FF698|nr:uncharacterized protein LOC126818884 [Patella vulgata]
MADGFENAFKAFIQSQQPGSYLDKNNNTDDDEDSYESESETDDKLSDDVPKSKVRNKKNENDGSSGEKSGHKPIPKLKLMVDPDYVPPESLSPFSLKRYIRSPNTHVVKLDSYSSQVLSKSNPFNSTHSNYFNEEIEKRLIGNCTSSEGTKKALFPVKVPFINSKKTQTPNSRLKCTYQAQIVLKKYGLQYPARKRKLTSSSVEKLSVSKSLSKDIKYNQLLSKDPVVNKTECDSHYFCAQGEGLSRNSPEAAKSVISSPANASVGESCLTDSSVSPMYDSIASTTNTFDNHYTDHIETVARVSIEACPPDRSDGHNMSRISSSKLECGNCDMTCSCTCEHTTEPKTKESKDRNSKSRRHTVCTESETDFTEIVSQHLTSQFGNKVKSSGRERKRSGKRKRNYSEIHNNHDPDFVYNEDDIEETNVSHLERKKRTRPRRNSSCLCCSNKASKRVRRQSLKCNMADFKNLSARNQKFIQFSVQLSNIQNKLHLLFCSVFPRLVPILNNITPESLQFQQIIDDILQTLETSDDQELQNDTLGVVDMFEDLHLKNSNGLVPIYEPKIQLCQNPEQCLNMFRDKVVSLLQLLLPSLIISLDSFLTNPKELEKFLDKVISSNCVK